MRATGNVQVKMKTGSWKRDFKMNWSLYLLFMPVLIYFIIFNYLPMFGITMAFQDFNAVKGFFGSEFIGFKNFIDFFTSPDFFTVLRNTLVISLLGLGIGFPLSIILALLLNEIYFTKFKKVVQTISYLPYFVSMVVIAGLIIEFVSTNGIITDLFVMIGFKRENLLQNPSYFWAINLLSDLWQGLGYGSIIFIAAITNVSQELNEAAAIDGANRLHRVLHVTLPAIMPTIITMLVLRLGLLMTVGFDKILLLYNPSIYETSDVISTHVARMGLERMQYGYAAAVGLFNSIVGTFLLITSNSISKKFSDSSVF
ncbi:MAG: putative aldouronate transport system permease protein [Clostridiales bacterium]|jgi:putative aldouronate transport system permease protein|nr:putative aldouronate transport system permease protein [Clostridiales bacterium]